MAEEGFLQSWTFSNLKKFEKKLIWTDKEQSLSHMQTGQG